MSMSIIEITFSFFIRLNILCNWKNISNNLNKFIQIHLSIFKLLSGYHFSNSDNILVLCGVHI